jgi:hypothetical protein
MGRFDVRYLIRALAGQPQLMYQRRVASEVVKR